MGLLRNALRAQFYAPSQGGLAGEASLINFPLSLPSFRLKAKAKAVAVPEEKSARYQSQRHSRPPGEEPGDRSQRMENRS